MKNSLKWFFAGMCVILLLSAMTVQPQLSLDEQNAIVDAVVQTMNPESIKATAVSEAVTEMINRLNNAGYVGLASALSVPVEDTSAQNDLVVPTATATPTPEMLVSAPETEVSVEAAAAPTVSATRMIETSVADYWDGAILQEDGTYRGLHAKFANSYAYTVGEDENGIVRQFHNEYTPNVWFNVDVVFENDGSLVWPPRMEMRHIGNVGEYTGHAESVFIDRSDNPVLPGQKAGFTISAYGSENLGWTTFYFQLYDADSGHPIEGGQGSFTYLAY